MKYIACIGIGFFFGWLYAHSVIATRNAARLRRCDRCCKARTEAKP